MRSPRAEEVLSLIGRIRPDSGFSTTAFFYDKQRVSSLVQSNVVFNPFLFEQVLLGLSSLFNPANLEL